MKIDHVYDSFVDYDDKELFCCRTNAGVKWFYAHEIPNTVLNPYLKKSKDKKSMYDKENESRYNKARECEVDKTDQYATDMKCRSRGILIACYSCGVIAGYKEMHGSESLQQVAAFLLELKKNFDGN